MSNQRRRHRGRVTPKPETVPVDDKMFVARLLHQDDKFVTVEIAKSDQTPLRVEEGDQFFTMCFVRGEKREDYSVMVPWNPFTTTIIFEGEEPNDTEQ
jgi:hypothetical protein